MHSWRISFTCLRNFYLFTSLNEASSVAIIYSESDSFKLLASFFFLPIEQTIVQISEGGSNNRNVSIACLPAQTIG